MVNLQTTEGRTYADAQDHTGYSAGRALCAPRWDGGAGTGSGCHMERPRYGNMVRPRLLLEHLCVCWQAGAGWNQIATDIRPSHARRRYGHAALELWQEIHHPQVGSHHPSQDDRPMSRLHGHHGITSLRSDCAQCNGLDLWARSLLPAIHAAGSLAPRLVADRQRRVVA